MGFILLNCRPIYTDSSSNLRVFIIHVLFDNVSDSFSIIISVVAVIQGK